MVKHRLFTHFVELLCDYKTFNDITGSLDGSSTLCLLGQYILMLGTIALLGTSCKACGKQKISTKTEIVQINLKEYLMQNRTVVDRDVISFVCS